MEISTLACNYLHSPLGVETPVPAFYWKLLSKDALQYQTAYRILVSSSLSLINANIGDIWDSGKLISDRTVNILYEGKSLLSRERYYWKVKSWDKDDKEGLWSDPDFFEMGLLKPDDWSAKWISTRYPYFDPKQVMPAPLIRKSFKLEKKAVNARVYVTGIGYFELYINGAKADDSVLNPPFTRYDSTVLYYTYDITHKLIEDENVIGHNWGSGPAWDSAIVLIPWYLYLYNGDEGILAEMYENIKSYVNFMSSMSNGYMVDFGLGDWCPPAGGPGDYKCPSIVTDTACYFICSKLLSEIGAILGKTEEQIKYGSLADSIKDAYCGNFVNEETGDVAGSCQTSLVCTLYFGLVEGEVRNKVIGSLVKEVERCNNHIDCGILGTKYVLQALTDAGRVDLAYKIASQDTYPGWGYWIRQGATTLWENWKGEWSLNHHMFSDISAWFYKGLAGINPDPANPGFKHIILRPGPVKGLEWVKASHESVHGRIECNWRVEEDLFHLEAVIPTNCKATLYLPELYKDKAIVVSKGNLIIKQ